MMRFRGSRTRRSNYNLISLSICPWVLDIALLIARSTLSYLHVSKLMGIPAKTRGKRQLSPRSP